MLKQTLRTIVPYSMDHSCLQQIMCSLVQALKRKQGGMSFSCHAKPSVCPLALSCQTRGSLLHSLVTSANALQASDWKEFTSPDGRKYYHNRKTKESKWTMPEEMKRAQAAAAAAGTATAAGGSAVPAQKPAAAAPPQLVKVPVAQSLSPAHAVAAQKSSQVSISSHSHPCAEPCSHDIHAALHAHAC